MKKTAKETVIDPQEPLLEPHTAAWFEALMEINQGQAIHTMSVVAVHGGNVDVCGICGDLPARTLRIAPKMLLVRLCADCEKIQSNMHGTKFTPASTT